MESRKKSTARITMRTVLEHVQALHGEMLTRFAAVDQRFVSIDKRFNGVDVRFDALEAKLGAKIDGVERRLTRQIDGIDKRLDDLEVNVIPKLKRAVAAR